DAQDRDENNVRLSDLDKGIAPPSEKRPKSDRNRTAFLFIGLILLAIITFIGGYFLLRTERVDLKANKQLPERQSSGKDIQKAAFDSISDSLTSPSPSPGPQSPAASLHPRNDQSLQTPIERKGREQVAPPIDPGIAATLAPSSESMATKPTPSPGMNGM